MAYNREWEPFAVRNTATIRGINEQREDIKSRINRNSKPVEEGWPKFNRFFHPLNFNYQSAKKIGSGAFGDVFLVNHKLVNGKKLTLKRFRPKNAPYAAWKELDSMAFFQHDNICRLLGAFCADVPTLVMEKCLGTANDFIDHLTTENVLQITVQIANALDFVHKKNFIHCDVRPSNILIRPDNVAVLTDFSDCIFLDDRDYNVGKGLHGTISFLNLDALENYYYSRKTDMWGLACTAYQLEQKKRLFSVPPNATLDRFFFADAIRNGIFISRRRRKPFFDVLDECRTLQPILRLLTQGHLDITGFLASDHLKNTMREYRLNLQEINQVENKFAKQHTGLVPSEQNDFSDDYLPVSMDFLTYYWEKDDITNALRDEGSFEIEHSSSEEDSGFGEINIRDRTSRVNSSPLQKTATNWREQPVSRTEEEPSLTTSNTFKSIEVDLNTCAYICHKCRLFICLSKVLIRAHFKRCNVYKETQAN